MNYANKLVLGTVQFGLDYGVNNQSGQVQQSEVNKILQLAKESGIKKIDTSSAYGTSESVLGKSLSENNLQFHIISKYPQSENSVAAIFASSLEKLQQKKLYGYLVHHFEFYQSHPQLWEKMKDLKAGDAFMDFVGPLGQPSEFCSEDIEELKKKRIVFVAGGVGTAPVYPQLKWLHEHGITADAIVGAKTKDLVILEKEMSAVSNLYITTDDGSYVRKGMGTDVLRDLVQNQGKQYDVCVAIGPMIMMKFVCLLTKELNIPTVVSMNPIMVDGTGMCGACRLMVGNEVKFACVDGPEFDGHLVDFDLAMKRQQMYKTEEGRALLRYQEGATHHGGCGQCGGDK